jgi:hypothetical protein
VHPLAALGRNRQRACQLAKVKPNYVELNGQDPAAYIVSANLARRNLSKGQQAMALAMIYPEPKRSATGQRRWHIITAWRTSTGRPSASGTEIRLRAERKHRQLYAEGGKATGQLLRGSTIDPRADVPRSPNWASVVVGHAEDVGHEGTAVLIIPAKNLIFL